MGGALTSLCFHLRLSVKFLLISTAIVMVCVTRVCHSESPMTPLFCARRVRLPFSVSVATVLFRAVPPVDRATPLHWQQMSSQFTSLTVQSYANVILLIVFAFGTSDCLLFNGRWRDYADDWCGQLANGSILSLCFHPLTLSLLLPGPICAPLPSSADIISTVEFNHTGELLATGDKGGRVVIFQREPEVTPPHHHPHPYRHTQSIFGIVVQV